VDVLQADAVRDWLVGSISQDAVQAIMADAFRPVRQREYESERAAIVANDPAPRAVLDLGRRGTPGSTVEALMWLLRERGLSCLDEPGNRGRLWRCDANAMKQISTRLLDLKSRSEGRLADWTEEGVAKLVSIWRAVRGRNT
jgi:hypothetical protein